MKKQNFAYIALVAVFTTSLACSLGGAVPISNGATPTAISSAVTPTTVPEPLPSSYADLLQKKITSGEWTQEVGLVTLLKVFAGELQFSEAGLEQGVVTTEGTGILLLAGNYLQTGTKQTAKDEIARLINLLVPTQEALDRFSIPEEQAAIPSASDDLVAQSWQDTTVAFTTDRSYQTEQECKNLWVHGFPDRRFPSFPCFQFGEAIPGNPYRVYYPLAWRGDASKDPYYRATLLALRDSIAEYKNLFTNAGPISIIFSTLDGEGESYDALTYFRDFEDGESCPIIIRPSALTGANLSFNQLIAHEIAHCFTAWNLKDQYRQTGYDSFWWSEGMAEYFSNVVYPAVNNEHQYRAAFASKSTTVSLLGMEYENFAFFQFLGNRVGPRGVIAMLGTMPTIPGRNAQLTALAAVPGMEDTFEDFVRTIMDNTLKDTNESVIEFPEEFTDEAYFSDIESQDFASRPFVVARYLVRFPSEKSFAIEMTSEGVGRSEWHTNGSKGNWEPFPTTAAGKCEELWYGGYVITTTPSAEYKKTLSTTSVDPDPCDKCLVGRWEATNDSIVSYMQSVVGEGGDNVPTVESVNGIIFLEFGADSIGSGGYENLIVHETGLGGVASAEVFVTFNGSAGGPYRADGSSLTGLGETTDIVVTVQIPSVGSTIIPFKQEDFPVSTSAPTRYVCEGDTLTMWPPADGATPIIYIRSGP